MAALILRAGQVFTGEPGGVIPDGAVRVEADRIAAVGPAREVLGGGRGAEVLNFPDHTLLPGLIDGHVHLVFDAGPDVVGRYRQDSDAALLFRAAANARLALRSGVTALRDCGGRGALTLEFRELVRSGLVPGPRVVACGAPVTTTGGHCHFFGLEADSAEEVLKAVRSLARAGADFIKIMATGGNLTPGSNPRRAQYPAETLRLAVEDAHRLGLKVAAHCHGTEGIRLAVGAGVDTIEHCSWLGAGAGFEFDEAVARELIRRGIFVGPTLSVGWAGPNGPVAPAERVGLTRRLVELGARLFAATDAGVPGTPFNSLVRELEIYAEGLGLDPAAALRAATAEGALAVGLEGVGRLKPGYLADLLVVRGDPLKTVSALRDVELVVLGGRVVVREGRLVEACEGG
jgi:imidazolonepropionase-like amidohydrolase